MDPVRSRALDIIAAAAISQPAKDSLDGLARSLLCPLWSVAELPTPRTFNPQWRTSIFVGRAFFAATRARGKAFKLG